MNTNETKPTQPEHLSTPEGHEAHAHIALRQARAILSQNEPTPQPETEPAWSARCDCYNGHNSSSGRCNARDVTDPTRKAGEPAKCERCRIECGVAS